MKPIYDHGCSSCRYLGSGPCKILDEKARFDFYICEAEQSHRSFIARFGSSPEAYTSGSLFGCVELTTLDKVALYNGLSLNPDEERRLLRVLSEMWRNHLGLLDYEKMSAGGLSFGRGNIVFPD